MSINAETDDKYRKSSKAIQRWVCSCQSGRRIAGCCAHVATVLYYLCYAKYTETIPPASQLNSIFVNISENQAANRPVIVRNKRRGKRVEITSEED